MQNTHSFKMNLPEMSDPVDVRELNDNFLVIDDALMAGLCKKELTTNNMGSSDPASRKYGWAPWIEIYNGNEFDVVVIDRNAPDLPSGTINIEAGKTHRMFINGTYYMNFYVQDQHEVTFKWFTNAETRINEIEPSGGGGVSSVNVTGASGSHIESSGGPITDSGTIELSISEGYSIPQTNKQTAWDSKAADLKLEINSSTFVITAQLKDASGNLIGNERTIDLPLESVVVSGTYDDQTKKVILTLQNGSTIEFSVADLVSGLQTELSASNTLDPDYIDYDASHRAVSDTEKNTWNSKQNAISDLETIRSGAAAGATAVQPGTMSTALALKQDSLSETQLAAVNSGINSTKVAQIETNKTNILYTLNRVGKNILPIDIKTLKARNTTGTWDGNSYTIQGVTFTINDDCTISVSGTNTSTTVNAILTLATRFDSLPKIPAGRYTLSGCPSGGGADTYHLNAYQGKTTSPQANYQDNGNGVTGEFDYSLAASNAPNIAIIIRVSYAITGTIVFSPMLRNASIEDGTYEHYALPNYDLTRLESEDRNALVEVVDDGAKNKLDFASLEYANGHEKPTVTKTDTTITIASGNAWARAVYRGIHLLAGTYVLSVNITSATFATGSVGTIRIVDNAWATGGVAYMEFNSIGKVSCIFTVDIESDLYFSFCPNYRGSNLSTANSFTATDVMICTEADWKISQNYAPFALPNTDLTHLEAEDRAALAEVVDSGAKNLSSWNGGSLSTAGFIIRNYPITLTPGNYVIAYRTTATGGNTQLTLNSVAAVTLPNSNANRRVGFFTVDTTKTNFSLYSDSSNNTITDFMICTEADFNVSQKFVPYRPSYDLVAALAQNGGFIDSTLGSIIANADLNSINKTTFAVYNEPANLPSGITGYCYVRTSVFDENSALQELYVIQPNPVSFFRIKLNNSWTVWTQTSNV